jgi:hypothetical protein
MDVKIYFIKIILFNIEKQLLIFWRVFFNHLYLDLGLKINNFPLYLLFPLTDDK